MMSRNGVSNDECQRVLMVEGVEWSDLHVNMRPGGWEAIAGIHRKTVQRGWKCMNLETFVRWNSPDKGHSVGREG